jgi:Na+-driven multidrug efflux pump
MIVMGFNQGMQPIAGYNFGARRYYRVKEVFFLTSKWATGVVFIGFIISVFFPNLAVSAFTDEPQLKEMAGHGLQTMNILFPIIGFQMVATNLFQCLGMVHKSIILSLSRQLLFLVPSVFLLPILFDVDGVWYSFPLSDFLASILTVFFLISLVRKLNRLNDGDNPDILGSKIK